MTKTDSDKLSLHLPTGRIEALTDAVFAIAMTLLVLNLAVPEASSGLTNIELHKILIGQVHKFYNYVLSFILLAVFWVVHHQQFHWIKRTDYRFLWINIFILILVALIPFSTDLVGNFKSDIVAETFFAGNMLVLGSLFLAAWVYATKNYRLIDHDLDDTVIRRGLRGNLITPIVSLLVIILSFFIPGWSMWLYLLIPIMLALKPFRTVR